MWFCLSMFAIHESIRYRLIVAAVLGLVVLMPVKESPRVPLRSSNIYSIFCCVSATFLVLIDGLPAVRTGSSFGSTSGGLRVATGSNCFIGAYFLTMRSNCCANLLCIDVAIVVIISSPELTLSSSTSESYLSHFYCV